jgi:hypothetical protein
MKLSNYFTFDNKLHLSKLQQLTKRNPMAIQMEFIDVEIPIHVIKAKYEGGLEQCLEDYKDLIGERVWYDEHLFRDGAMNGRDAEEIVKHWKSLGFIVYEEVDGKPSKWIDVCVHDMLWGATLDCDWLQRDLKTRSLYLKGTEQGEVIGRRNF